ncbi:hypothetical protein F5Y19DRAFT_269633 [Xylariaceae sp. FL1651]|nr:hypothetical protein F5Y19DRAFT_269633 [Xylariaceae sp. FL1651]
MGPPAEDLLFQNFRRLSSHLSKDSEATLGIICKRRLDTRRAILDELDAIEDRARRLNSDLRRLSPLRFLLPYGILAAMDEQRKLLYLEGVDKISLRGIARLFLDASHFNEDARAVIAFCERSAQKWSWNPRRGRDCSEEIWNALLGFPKVRRRRSYYVKEEMAGDEKGKETMKETLQKPVERIEKVPYRIEEPWRWRNYSTYY